MDAVAAEAGVTKGSLYWHFKSKKEVVLASCMLYYRKWRESMTAELRHEPSPSARLELAIRFSVRSCLLDQKNRIFTTEILALSLYDQEVRASWAQFYDTARAHFSLLLEQAVAAGELEVDDPVETANFMLCAMEGIKQQALFEPAICSRQNEERICQQLMQALGAASPQFA
jgi:AcrR family transcriptional regulator